MSFSSLNVSRSQEHTGCQYTTQGFYSKYFLNLAKYQTNSTNAKYFSLVNCTKQTRRFLDWTDCVGLKCEWFSMDEIYDELSDWLNIIYLNIPDIWYIIPYCHCDSLPPSTNIHQHSYALLEIRTMQWCYPNIDV